MKQEKIINNCRYRVNKQSTLWLKNLYFYYPEERYKWWPFWFKFIYSNGGHICFNKEQEAWDFIDRVSKA